MYMLRHNRTGKLIDLVGRNEDEQYFMSPVKFVSKFQANCFVEDSLNGVITNPKTCHVIGDVEGYFLVSDEMDESKVYTQNEVIEWATQENIVECELDVITDVFKQWQHDNGLVFDDELKVFYTDEEAK